MDAANVFKSGKVDAAVSWSPDVYVAARERQGGHILASTKEASNLIADIFVARGDFLQQHPEDARRFVAGWLKGVEMVHKSPERAAVLLQKSLSGVNTLEDAKGMLEDVKLPDYAENRGFFNPQGSLVKPYCPPPEVASRLPGTSGLKRKARLRSVTGGASGSCGERMVPALLTRISRSPHAVFTASIT